MTDVPKSSPIIARFLHWARRVRSRPSFASAIIVGIVLFALLSPTLNATRSLLLAFNGGAVLFLVAMAVTMARATGHHMRQRAQLQNEGKWTVLGLSLAIAGVILIALYLELHGAKSHSLADVVLASSSILLSWLFLATVFAMHYAHGFYLTPDPAQGGLVFPGTDAPDYWDFMYFSVVLSMACQVSDVQITNRVIRRVALLHSMVAFFFNVIIIAITVNVVAGVL